MTMHIIACVRLLVHLLVRVRVCRFYKLFESVFRYIVDYGKYLADLSEGFYIQHTVRTAPPRHVYTPSPTQTRAHAHTRAPRRTHLTALSPPPTITRSHRWTLRTRRLLAAATAAVVFLQVGDVLLDTNGKQLMCEALYLLGTILLIMDMRVPGPIRERLIIAHYRHKGESATVSIGAWGGD